MNTIQRVKKAMKEDKLVIGFDETVKNLKKENVNLAVVASNAPFHVKEEVQHLTRIAEAEYDESSKDSVELGATCRKSFGVATLSIKK